MIKLAILAAITLALSSIAVMAVQNVMAALDQLPGAGSLAPGNQFFHGTGEQPSDPYRFSVGHQFEHNQQPGDPYNPGDPYRNAPGQQFLEGGVSTGPG